MIEFKPVTVPTSWNGQRLVNGKLGPCDLHPVFFPGTGNLDCHTYTARAVGAMQAVCLADTKLHLSATGAYRSYEQQVNAFNTRYTSSYLPVRNVLTSQRTWNGQTYYLRRGMSPVAVPGTSNHGYGIAVDFAWWTGVNLSGLTDIAGITHASYKTGWEWVQANAVSFGFSWEGARPGQPGWEPWHLRHIVGNDVSPRVLQVEAFFAALA